MHSGAQYHEFILASPRDRIVRDRFPKMALDLLPVRELTIVHSQEIGSHTLFLGRIAADEDLAEGTQLHHTAGFHQAYRRRQGMPLAEV